MSSLPLEIIKIDAEGCTLEVLRGMGSLLDTVSVMHLETESREYFKGQHLHGDVVDFIEHRGFRLIKMTHNMGLNTQHDSVWIKM